MKTLYGRFQIEQKRKDRASLVFRAAKMQPREREMGRSHLYKYMPPPINSDHPKIHRSLPEELKLPGKHSKVHFTPRSAIKKTEDKNVEISEGLIKMIRNIAFDGELTGEPYQHLEAFEDICDLFKTKGDEVKLHLFPFTLTEKAKDWFKTLPPDSITTWEELKSAFLLRHFPNSKIKKLKDEIRNFKQGKENLERAWERYKDLYFCIQDARKLLDDFVAHHLDWSTDEEELQEETETAQVSKVTSNQEELQFKCERCGYAHPTKFCTWQQTPPLSHVQSQRKN
ncbi:hypothetical protein OSB04_029242 [Centaurea solstitialis]|uniref:Retrotransposon gag domain-containing protein n=1 Tax=Centaurea solstitialis TaxID=347529 RepID=A0AA38WBY5_9ASTR|nr:hypothetical protein OSB04_029242 [Centaurea solstitialis]